MHIHLASYDFYIGWHVFLVSIMLVVIVTWVICEWLGDDVPPVRARSTDARPAIRVGRPGRAHLRIVRSDDIGIGFKPNTTRDPRGFTGTNK